MPSYLKRGGASEISRRQCIGVLATAATAPVSARNPSLPYDRTSR
jgi:hypothetical protein